MRYGLGASGQMSWKLESNPYTKEAPTDNYFGYLNEDIDLSGASGQNPHSPLASNGSLRRGPQIYSPDKRDYGFSIPILIYDDKIPLECALGERTITDVLDGGAVKVGDKHTFTETTTLPPITIEHANRDFGSPGDFEEWWIGCKANLGIEFSVGEYLKATLDIVAASYDWDETGTAPSVGPPTLKSPFKFIYLASVMVGAKAVATITSGNLNWDNGLKANHHGGRDAYSVSEDGGDNKYDMGLGIKITDLDLYKRAVENAIPVTVVIQFIRGRSGDSTVNDAVNITLTDCKLLVAPISKQHEGSLEADIKLGPTNTTIEIITPV